MKISNCFLVVFVAAVLMFAFGSDALARRAAQVGNNNVKKYKLKPAKGMFMPDSKDTPSLNSYIETNDPNTYEDLTGVDAPYYFSNCIMFPLPVEKYSATATGSLYSVIQENAINAAINYAIQLYNNGFLATSITPMNARRGYGGSYLVVANQNNCP